MSQALIRRAFEKRLAAIVPALATAYENRTYVPVSGTPYQRANLLPATPDNSTQGPTTYFEIGVFQITLCYPSGNGSTDIEARVQLVRNQFKRGTSMTEGSVMTLVTHTPRVAPGYADGDRWCIPVSVTYQAQITT